MLGPVLCMEEAGQSVQFAVSVFQTMHSVLAQQRAPEEVPSGGENDAAQEGAMEAMCPVLSSSMSTDNNYFARSAQEGGDPVCAELLVSSSTQGAVTKPRMCCKEQSVLPISSRGGTGSPASAIQASSRQETMQVDMSILRDRQQPELHLSQGPAQHMHASLFSYQSDYFREQEPGPIPPAYAAGAEDAEAHHAIAEDDDLWREPGRRRHHRRPDLIASHLLIARRGRASSAVLSTFSCHPE